jgi:hypothetical protein
MEDLAEAIHRLVAAGYCEAFRAERGGLRSLGSGSLHEPESLAIEEIVRFEGTSDPEDQAVLFALSSQPPGVRGTYVAAYGLYIDPLDAAIVHRLRRASTRASAAASVSCRNRHLVAAPRRSRPSGIE